MERVCSPRGRTNLLIKIKVGVWELGGVIKTADTTGDDALYKQTVHLAKLRAE